MKRYRLCGIMGVPTSNPLGKLPCMMREDPDGEWVKYQDVVKFDKFIKIVDLKGSNGKTPKARKPKQRRPISNNMKIMSGQWQNWKSKLKRSLY